MPSLPSSSSDELRRRLDALTQERDSLAQLLEKKGKDEADGEKALQEWHQKEKELAATVQEYERKVRCILYHLLPPPHPAQLKAKDEQSQHYIGQLERRATSQTERAEAAAAEAALLKRRGAVQEAELHALREELRRLQEEQTSKQHQHDRALADNLAQARALQAKETELLQAIEALKKQVSLAPLFS